MSVLLALQSATPDQTLTGVLFSRPPVFPTGTVTPGPVTLTGVLFSRAPTFPAGTVTSQITLAGVLFSRPPIFPTGTVTSQITLAGVLFSRAPVFPVGVVTAGPVTVGGVLFTVNPLFPVGVITTIGGILPIVAPTMGQFQRLDNRLALANIWRGGRLGFRLSEGWERVSDPFIFDGHPDAAGNQQETMEAVAAAWAAHAGSLAATLQTAIHQALDDFGLRRPDGSELV